MRVNLSHLSAGVLALVGSGLLISCATEADNPMRSLETKALAPKPDARMASRSGESLESIGTGYWVFQRKCLECHEARVPKDPSNKDWHPIMEGMSWNAGLSSGEQASVMTYLRAAAR